MIMILIHANKKNLERRERREYIQLEPPFLDWRGMK